MRFLKNIHTGKIQSIKNWVDEFEQAKEPGDLSGAERVEEQLINGDLVLDWYCTEYNPNHNGKYCSFCEICGDIKSGVNLQTNEDLKLLGDNKNV